MGDGADVGGIEARGLNSYKLFAPPLRSDSIGREPVLARVFGAELTRVMLLQAPAGYGKSTTLRQIMSACDERGFLTAWLTFDEADNDPSRFLVHFRALLESIPREDAEPLADPIDPSDRGYRSDWAIERLLRFGKPVALFLDYFQVLQNPAILKFFREFLDRVPYGARVFISSRSIPEIGLARLIANGTCLALRAEELRFSPSEAGQFFAKTEQIT
ncbi:MAG: hypothetical protein ACLP1D_01630, partial [Xanthobacteraceae bacterium]